MKVVWLYYLARIVYEKKNYPENSCLNTPELAISRVKKHRKQEFLFV